MSDKTEKEAFRVFPIGYVRRKGKKVNIEILEPFRPALKQLNHFSHVMIFWWAHKHDNAKSRGALQCEPPYAKGKVTGVFATRAEYRPNPIAMTTCNILKLTRRMELSKWPISTLLMAHPSWI